MALPQIEKQETQNVLAEIRKELKSDQSREIFSSISELKNDQEKFTRNTEKKTATNSSRERIDRTNDEVIAKSQKQENPMVDLLSTMSKSIFATNRILKNILKVLEKQSDNIGSSIGSGGLGLGDSNFGDWFRKKKAASARSGRPPTGRPGKIKGAVKAGAKGAAGLAAALGLGYVASKLGISEEAQDAVANGATAASTVNDFRAERAAARAASGVVSGAEAGAAAEAGGTKLAGKLAGKLLGAPLAGAISVYENFDELSQTGKVDPIKQLQKTASGLSDLFDMSDSLFSMKRLGGLADTLSGSAGAVLATGTQVGSAVREQVPTEWMDSLFSGFGLFGKTPDQKVKEMNEEYEKTLAEREKQKKLVAPNSDKSQGITEIKGVDGKPLQVQLTDKDGKPVELEKKDQDVKVEVNSPAIPQPTPEQVKNYEDLKKLIPDQLKTLFSGGVQQAASVASSPVAQAVIRAIPGGAAVSALAQAQQTAATQDASTVTPQPQTQIGTQQGQPQAQPQPQTGTLQGKPVSMSDVVYKSSDDDKKYFTGDVSKLDGMNPEFITKLKAASAETGKKLKLNSGFRSQEEQNRLRAEAVKKYGSEAAASKWVAKTSIHTTGNAIDLSGMPDDPEMVKALEKQGLHRPMGHEAWHWESAETKGKSRAGLAGKLIAERQAKIDAAKSGQPVSLGQVAQNTAAAGAMIMAGHGVPGAATAASVIANPKPLIDAGKSVVTKSKDAAANLKSLTEDQAFMSSLRKFSKERGIDPNNVMAMMKYESGGYKTDVTNSLGYKGLFQIGKQVFQDGGIGKKLASAGFSYDNFEKESAARQLQAYQIYYDEWQKRTGSGNKIDTLGDMAALQLAPGTVKNASGEMYRSGQSGYGSNKALDINKDGVINREEYGQKMKDRYGNDAAIVNAALAKAGQAPTVTSSPTVAVAAGGAPGSSSPPQPQGTVTKAAVSGFNPSNLDKKLDDFKAEVDKEAPGMDAATKQSMAKDRYDRYVMEEKAKVAGVGQAQSPAPDVTQPAGTDTNIIAGKLDGVISEVRNLNPANREQQTQTPQSGETKPPDPNSVLGPAMTPVTSAIGASGMAAALGQGTPSAPTENDNAIVGRMLAPVTSSIGASGMATILGQQNAKDTPFRKVDQNSGRGYTGQSKSGSARAALEATSGASSPNSYQTDLGLKRPRVPGDITGIVNALAGSTVSGLTPPGEIIPIQTPVPSDLSTLGNRVAQNWQVMNNPNAQAVISALQSSGVQIPSAAIPQVPSQYQGLSAIEGLRQAGTLNSLMSGDVAGALRSVSPSTPMTSGIQNNFMSSVAAISGRPTLGIANAINRETGGVLKGTGIPSMIGNGLINAATGSLSALLPSQSPVGSSVLEASTLNDQQPVQSQSIQVPIPSSPVQQKPNQRDASGGMQMGVQTPLQVYNNESSLRRLVDALLAYSFG